MPSTFQILFTSAAVVLAGVGGFYLGGERAAHRRALETQNRAQNGDLKDSGISARLSPGGAMTNATTSAADRQNRALAAVAAVVRQGYSRTFGRDSAFALALLTREDIPEAFEMARKMKPADGRILRTMLYGRWAELDPQAVAEAALSGRIEEPPERSHALSLAANEWAKKDPALAKAWVLGLTEPGEIQSAMSGVVSALVAEDPAAAFEWLNSLPPSRRKSYLYELAFTEWGTRDPEGAALRVTSLPVGPIRTEAVRGLMTYWSEKDPAAALAWARNLPASDTRSQAFYTVLNQWAETDPARAASEAAKLSLGAMRQPMFSTLINVAAETDPALALRIADQIPAGQGRDRALEDASRYMLWRNPKAALELAIAGRDIEKPGPMALQAIGRWAEDAPVEALGYLAEKIPEEQQRANVEQSALQSWAGKDPRAAIEWMVQHGRNSPAELGAVVRGWAAQSPTTALAWVRTRPAGTERLEMENLAIAGLANLDPTRAAGEFARLPGSEHSQATASNLADAWSREDPAAAAAWANGLGDEGLRAEAVAKVASNWAAQDYEKSAVWLEKLPPGAGRDAAVNSYAQVAANQDPAGAVAWAETIAAAGAREESLKKIYDRWKKTDSKAANAWLDGSKALDAETAQKWRN